MTLLSRHCDYSVLPGVVLSIQVFSSSRGADQRDCASWSAVLGRCFVHSRSCRIVSCRVVSLGSRVTAQVSITKLIFFRPSPGFQLAILILLSLNRERTRNTSATGSYRRVAEQHDWLVLTHMVSAELQVRLNQPTHI